MVVHVCDPFSCRARPKKSTEPFGLLASVMPLLRPSVTAEMVLMPSKIYGGYAPVNESEATLSELLRKMIGWVELAEAPKTRMAVPSLGGGKPPSQLPDVTVSRLLPTAPVQM